MGNPTKWGFSVCYFRRGFATPLKVGKNRGTPRSGALVRFQSAKLWSQRSALLTCEVKNKGGLWDI